MKPPTAIRYGFLTGNLLAGDSQEDIDAMNVSASIHKFAWMVKRAIESAYPTAEVTVTFQDRSGVIPADIATFAMDEDGNDLPEVAEDVEEIGSSVFLAEWRIPGRNTAEQLADLLKEE